MDALIAERAKLTAALDDCERGATPGSKEWRAESAALKALAAFDAAHPEALAEIRRRHSASVLAGKDSFGEDAPELHCECGKVSGVRCEWEGPASETVLVEWMPPHLRASHTAAGNRGAYPTNGSLLLCVEASCADTLAESEGEWLTQVEA